MPVSESADGWLGSHRRRLTVSCILCTSNLSMVHAPFRRKRGGPPGTCQPSARRRRLAVRPHSPSGGAETMRGATREGRVRLGPETDLPIHFSTSSRFRSPTVDHAFHPCPEEGASRFHAIGASSRTIMGFGAGTRAGTSERLSSTLGQLGTLGTDTRTAERHSPARSLVSRNTAEFH